MIFGFDEKVLWVMKQGNFRMDFLKQTGICPLLVLTPIVMNSSLDTSSSSSGRKAPSNKDSKFLITSKTLPLFPPLANAIIIILFSLKRQRSNLLAIYIFIHV
jgi:hypothetical protein